MCFRFHICCIVTSLSVTCVTFPATIVSLKHRSICFWGCIFLLNNKPLDLEWRRERCFYLQLLMIVKSSNYIKPMINLKIKDCALWCIVKYRPVNRKDISNTSKRQNRFLLWGFVPVKTNSLTILCGQNRLQYVHNRRIEYRKVDR
jgi:hypothetical protein